MTCKLNSTSIPSKRFMEAKGVENKLKILLGSVCCLLFIIIPVLSIPVYAFRIFLILLAKIFRPDLGEIFNGLSSYLVNDYFYNKNCPRASIIVSLVIRGRDVSIEELKQVLLERWINAKDLKTGKSTFEQFQQYPVRWMGFTFWKNCKDTFSINNHVFLEKHDDTVNDEKLNAICEKILNAAYPPNKSPWEVHLVKNYNSDQLPPNDKLGDQTTIAILFKVHHCLADGYSMLNALVEGFGQSSLANVELPKPRSPKRNFWENLTSYIFLPFSSFYEISYAASHLFRSSPWKVPDKEKEWHQFCAKSDFILINRVKFIKNQLGVSFTSVLLSAISSAIYKNIKNAKEKDFKEGKWKGVLENDQDNRSMYCLSALPLPGHPKCLTNHTTVALFDLPIGKYDSCVDRLKDVDAMLTKTKNTCIPAFVPLYTSVVGCHFYPVGKFLGTQRAMATGSTW